MKIQTRKANAVESTKRTASTEMSMQAPTQADYELMQQLFPTPSDLMSYPAPEDVARQFISLPPNTRYRCADTEKFLTRKGVASYYAVYTHAVVPLRELLAASTLGERLDYLVDNPILYKKDKDEKIMNFRDDARACLAGNTLKKRALKNYVALCFSNLSEWFYLSSNTAYHYLRDYLIEKFRFLRREVNADSYIPNGHSHVHMKELPQRPTTSRSRGENETELYTVNAGYRVVDDIDDQTGAVLGKAIQLVVWFFHDAKTQKSVFTDYFDIDENEGVMDALDRMRTSDLYRGWVRQFTPKQYENVCSIFKVRTEVADKELEDLTPISQDPTENA